MKNIEKAQIQKVRKSSWLLLTKTPIQSEKQNWKPKTRMMMHNVLLEKIEQNGQIRSNSERPPEI